MSLKAKIALENQTKVCPRCNRDLPLNSYNKGNGMYGRRSICRDCEHLIQNTPERIARRRELELARRANPEYVKKRNAKDRERIHSSELSYRKSMLRSAKARALKFNLEFNIDLDDIILPKVCPLLNIPLSINSSNKDYSYSLDKIDPKKGYVKGNVWVISFRANKIKNDASLSELELLTSNLRKYTTNEDN